MSGHDHIHTFADISRYWARETPEKIAQIFEDRTTTYAELDRRATQVANGLIAAGVKPQQRVACLDKNSDLFFELLLGTGKSNTVLVGVNYRLAPPEVAWIINDAEAEILFVGPEYYGLIEEIRSDIPGVHTIVAMAGPHDDWPAFEAWREGQSDKDPLVAVAPDDVAIQLYTSGTTGHPKGVELTNANYDHMVGNFAELEMEQIGAHDVLIVCMPVYHVAGTNVGVIGLMEGATNVITREVNPPEIIDLIETHKITMALFVPAVIRLILMVPGVEKRDLSSVGRLLYGASPISLDLLKRAMETFGCDFIQVYGLTETVGQATFLPASDHDPRGNERMRSCGKPVANFDIIVTSGDGTALPPGEVGEVWIRSKTVMKGYYNNPDATRDSITDDGWFKSGDAAYFDEDGYVYIYDRVKDMIVSGGENIYPAEVENAIMSHPAVSDAAVIGVPDETWGEAVKAIVVLESDAEASDEEIITHARKQIAGYKVPKSVDFAAELPRNPSGKVLKRELREEYWKDEDRQVS